MPTPKKAAETTPAYKSGARWHILLLAAAWILAFILLGLFLGGLAFTDFDFSMMGIIIRRFPAIIGLPVAAISAFIVVVVLEQQSGPMEFQGFGFKFKGASGQVILWLICFLAIAAAIKLLW